MGYAYILYNRTLINIGNFHTAQYDAVAEANPCRRQLLKLLESPVERAIRSGSISKGLCSLSENTYTKMTQEGVKSYYQAKIEECELIINEKSQDLRRLEAQRNALNAKGSLLDCVSRLRN